MLLPAAELRGILRRWDGAGAMAAGELDDAPFSLRDRLVQRGAANVLAPLLANAPTAAAGSPLAHTADKIVLRKAPLERGVRRPEYFSAIDIDVHAPRGGDRATVGHVWRSFRGLICRSRRRGAASLCDPRAPP
jgi:hypothetical protein